MEVAAIMKGEEPPDSISSSMQPFNDICESDGLYNSIYSSSVSASPSLLKSFAGSAIISFITISLTSERW